MAKYTAPVLLRCESCGAAIRAGEKYHKLHIKGRPLYFCPICVSLSEYTAKGEKNEKDCISSP